MIVNNIYFGTFSCFTICVDFPSLKIVYESSLSVHLCMVKENIIYSLPSLVYKDLNKPIHYAILTRLLKRYKVLWRAQWILSDWNSRIYHTVLCIHPHRFEVI